MGGERRGGSQRSEQDAGQHDGRAVASEAPREPLLRASSGGIRPKRQPTQNDNLIEYF